MTVSGMMRRMDARELTDWAAYERLEPFGDRVGQMMVAQLTALIGNALRGKTGREVKVDDLMPRFETDRGAEQDWRQMKRALQAQFAAAEKDAPKSARKKG